MTDLFRDLYETLLNGIKEIEKNNPDPEKQIEPCFHLSESIRRQADEAAAAAAFKNEEEEIEFFKTIRPGFTSPVEFYSILYRAKLFIPAAKLEQMEFWNSELQRAELFLVQNADMLAYIKSGSTINDRKYFLRDGSEETLPIHDELIAKLLARERYVDYIRIKMFTDITEVNP